MAAEGKAEGKAKALLAVLRARHIALARADERTILGTRDNAMLDRWLAAAASCRSVSELLGAQPGRWSPARKKPRPRGKR